jgi:MFS family permease
MFFAQTGYTPLAPFLIPRHLVGSVLSLQGFANMLVLPFAGPAIDAKGSRFMLWVGLGVQALANLLASASTDLWVQMCGRAVQGGSAGIVFAAQIAFVMDYFEEPLKSQHVGTVLGSTILGGMLGPPVLSSAYAASAGLALRQV